MDRKCVRFTYGGCGAKGNNFEEESKCETNCSGVTGETGGTQDRLRLLRGVAVGLLCFVPRAERVLQRRV